MVVADNQPQSRGWLITKVWLITIPQSELLRHGDHASLAICGFIASRDGSMIDIISSGKR